MPTPNDFNRVTLTGKQEAPSGEFGPYGPQSGTLPGPSSGNYPDTFGGYGEHYNPASGNYPENYSRVDLGGDNTSSYKRRSSEGRTGNFAQARVEAGLLPEYGPDLVPNPVPSKQFSSNVNGNPEALLRSTISDVSAHAEMNASYGLTQPVATLGSHPWLRDECTNTSTLEPGNAVPKQPRGVPLQRGDTNK